MKNSPLNLIYAINGEELTHISQVESGLKCDCACPSCGARLIARKGDKVSHHFAHYNSENCEYGYETSLHMAAKDVIARAKRIWIPEVRLSFGAGKQEILYPSTEIEIDDVRLEKALSGIVPDIVLTAGGKTLIVEIFVTHAIDDEKLARIRKMNVSALEIDLSKIDIRASHSDLVGRIIGDSPDKHRKYNALEEAWKQRYVDVSDVRRIVTRGHAFHIDRCPISVRTWRGKPYANFIHDCIDCAFFIAQPHVKYIDEKDHGVILCSGRERIASKDDFALTLEERRRKYDSKHERDKRDAILANRCPICGGTLVLRNGPHGEFWGCSSYPHCRFTLFTDPETGELVSRA